MMVDHQKPGTGLKEVTIHGDFSSEQVQEYRDRFSQFARRDHSGIAFNIASEEDLDDAETLFELARIGLLEDGWLS